MGQALRVDARKGGQIVEVGSDNHEQVWGTIKTYDPFSYLNMDFHFPHPSEKSPGFSTVEVRFTALGDDRTRVELKQSNWEALGEVAKMVQGGYRQALGRDLRGCLQNGVRALIARDRVDKSRARRAVRNKKGGF